MAFALRTAPCLTITAFLGPVRTPIYMCAYPTAWTELGHMYARGYVVELLSPFIAQVKVGVCSSAREMRKL